jgi:hypothetical protein
MSDPVMLDLAAFEREMAIDEALIDAEWKAVNNAQHDICRMTPDEINHLVGDLSPEDLDAFNQYILDALRAVWESAHPRDDCLIAAANMLEFLARRKAGLE